MTSEAPASERRRLEHDVPIRRVTLLEDRAHVERAATLSVPAGVTRVRVVGVAPVIADKTLIARVMPGSAPARAVDARVLRRAVTEPLDAGDVSGDVEELKLELEKLDDAIVEADAERASADKRIRYLDDLARHSLDEIAIDAAWGTHPSTAAPRELSDLADRRREARRELVTHKRRLSARQRERDRLHRRIVELSTPSSKLEASLEIDILAEEEGRIELAVDYLVPGACWRPYHTAELRAGEVRLTTDACVWQNTGEAWKDVELTFSTERASLGNEPPELGTDLLRVRKKSPALHVEMRDKAIDEGSLGAGAVSSELPGIDDGGEPVALKALSRSSIPSDGKPHRVTLGTFTAPAEAELVSYPELEPCVLVKTTQHNAGERPVLAGPVDLIQKSGLSGRTSVLFIAPAERFELGWGPEGELRVQRDVEIREESTGVLSSWVEQTHKVEVRISNLGDRRHSIQLRERVPVSEIEKVKVEPLPDRTTDEKVPDKDGFVDWTVEIGPHATAEVVLRYMLKRHTDVVGL